MKRLSRLRDFTGVRPEMVPCGANTILLICFSAAWGAKYPRRACTVNPSTLTLTKWDYFLAALAAIRARKFFSC